MFNNLKNKIDSIDVLSVILILICIFTSLFYLDKLPKFINVDEAGTILNSWSLIQNGTDRYGVSYPIYPNNYYDGQSALATILVALFFKLFGYNLFVARLPYALIRILCAFLILNMFKEDNKKSIILLFLYTIWPCFIMSSRFVLDCNLMLYTLIIGSYFFIRYLNSNKIYLLVFSGIFFGLIFYTYALSYLMIPIFIVLFLAYLFFKNKITIKRCIIFLIPVIMLGFPLLIKLLVEFDIIPEFNFLGISFTKIINNRLSDFSIKNINLENIANLIKAIFIRDRFKTMSYLFGGPVYYLSIVLVPLFIYKTIKGKDVFDVYFLLMFFSIFAVLILIKSASTYRTNAIFLPVLYMSATVLSKINYKKLILLMLCYLAMFSIFVYNYTVNYNVGNNSVMFDNGNYEALQYAKTLNKDIYIVNSRMGEEYVYYFLFNDVDINDYPKEYPPENIYDKKNGVHIYLGFNKIVKTGVYLVNEENLTEDFDIFKYCKVFNTWRVYYN